MSISHLGGGCNVELRSHATFLHDGVYIYLVGHIVGLPMISHIIYMQTLPTMVNVELKLRA